MAKLAALGGRPVSKNMIGRTTLVRRPDLERKYLLEAHKSGMWNDDENRSQAGLFAGEWAAFNKARFCVPVTNGTHSLQVALECLGVGAGDEVIVPGLTWQATASVVCDVNAVPILVDVEPDTLTIDPDAVEAAVTRRTRAIIPVHLYHRLADLGRLQKIARKHDLFIVEDCAHTHGSRWGQKGAGAVGDFGSFSFQMSKLMTSGEGGALLTSNAKLYRRARSASTCGREVGGERVHSGNFRLPSLQAAVLRGQLAAMRKNAPLIDRNGLALDRAVAAAPGVEPLRRSRKITRQCGYAFVFLYDKKAYGGLSGWEFRKALTAELGVAFACPYIPLNRSDVYYPHTKKRHSLDKGYLKAIDPRRWKLPVSNDLFEDSAIVTGFPRLSWDVYGTAPARAHLLTDAITKIHDNRKELLDAVKKTRKKRR